eukprot:GHVU01091928.1.p1 GENE.GHVU01091928.1~~GHVU01091928.1.p1  ORF type:complete len:228 (-),score=40.95 GHVU01091928.1:1598-2281(-)
MRVNGLDGGREAVEPGRVGSQEQLLRSVCASRCTHGHRQDHGGGGRNAALCADMYVYGFPPQIISPLFPTQLPQLRSSSSSSPLLLIIIIIISPPPHHHHHHLPSSSSSSSSPLLIIVIISPPPPHHLPSSTSSSPLLHLIISPPLIPCCGASPSRLRHLSSFFTFPPFSSRRLVVATQIGQVVAEDVQAQEEAVKLRVIRGYPMIPRPHTDAVTQITWFVRCSGSV